MRLETLATSLMDIQIIAPGSVPVVNKNPSFITQYKQYRFYDSHHHICHYNRHELYKKMQCQNFWEKKYKKLSRDLMLKHVISKWGHLKFQEK